MLREIAAFRGCFHKRIENNFRNVRIVVCRSPMKGDAKRQRVSVPADRLDIGRVDLNHCEHIAHFLAALHPMVALLGELASWESDHPEACARERDDGQFFGFTNNANGKLQRATSFVFIPAVRDAAVDAADTGRAPIARLMELVVRSAIERRTEVQAFRTRISEEYRRLTLPIPVA